MDKSKTKDNKRLTADNCRTTDNKRLTTNNTHTKTFTVDRTQLETNNREQESRSKKARENDTTADNKRLTADNRTVHNRD